MTSRPIVMELLAHALFVILAVVVAVDLYVLWHPTLAGSAT